MTGFDIADVYTLQALSTSCLHSHEPSVHYVSSTKASPISDPPPARLTSPNLIHPPNTSSTTSPPPPNTLLFDHPVQTHVPPPQTPPTRHPSHPHPPRPLHKLHRLIRRDTPIHTPQHQHQRPLHPLRMRKRRALRHADLSLRLCHSRGEYQTGEIV